MFMGYKVIYISQAEHLHLYLDNLKVEKENTDILIPVADIQILVIDNYKAYLTVPLMNKLTEKNVCTILCGVDHLPKTYILPMNGNYATSGNIAKQIEWTDEIKKILHREIVKHKIINQYIILRKNHKSEDVVSKLKEYSETVLNGDVTNREGLASKMYFREMYGEDFVRMDEDVVNAGLNYGYSIFRSLITSIIVGKGYLPNLAFFHRGKQNSFNLSDDIIEVFRPIVDDYVYNNLLDEILFKTAHKKELIDLTNKKINIDNRKQTIGNAINLYLDSIFRFIDDQSNEILFPFPIPYDNEI